MFLQFIYYLLLPRVCTTVHAWKSDDNHVGLVLPFHICMDPQIELRLMGLHGNCLYPLNYLTDVQNYDVF